MLWSRIAAVCLSILFLHTVHAQDTLPQFSVTTKGNDLVLIKWKNNYRKITQISIQRSHDSSKNFRTIWNVAEPRSPLFSYVDAKAPTMYMYYRLFIQLDSASFFFTPAKRTYWDTSRIPARPAAVITAPSKNIPASNKAATTTTAAADSGKALRPPAEKNSSIGNSLPVKTTPKREDTLSLTKKSPAEKIPATRETETANTSQGVTDNRSTTPPPAARPEKHILIKKRDTIIGSVAESRLRAFIDSLVTKTKDTFVLRYSDTLLIKPYVPKEVYKPSTTIYTDKDGNVNVNLPDFNSYRYSVEFYDEKGRWLFAIGHIKESPITIDKANFLQAGWYRFELKQDGKIREKNKFLIPKDL